MTWTVNTLARVTAKMTSQGGEAVQNVFWIRNATSDVGNGTASAHCVANMENIYSGLASFLSEELTFVAINVFLEATNEALGDFAWPTLTVGGATGDQLPASACLLSLLRTGFSRRVGRKYWGPFSESGQDGGSWISTIIAAGQAAALAHATSFLAAGVTGTGVLFNFTMGAGIPFSQVATLAPVRSQRRRNVGIGI